MTTIDYLPLSAQDTAEAQGWDDESIIIHLTAFISKQNLNTQLGEYFAAIAEEENADQ